MLHHRRFVVGGRVCARHPQRRGGVDACVEIRHDAVLDRVGRGVSEDPLSAARSAVVNFKGLRGRHCPIGRPGDDRRARRPHRCVVEELTLATGGNYRFFGGGAGDDGRFQKTHVFAGTQALYTTRSSRSRSCRAARGRRRLARLGAAGAGLRVTEAEGTRLIGLNGAPAIEAFEEHAEATGQTSTRRTRCRFSCTTCSASRAAAATGCGCRWRIGDDGAVSCAAAIPHGAIVHIMKTTPNPRCRRRAGDTVGARSARRPQAGRGARVRLRRDAAAPRPGVRRRTARPAPTCWSPPVSSAATPTARSRGPKASSAASTTAPRWSASSLNRRELVPATLDLIVGLSAPATGRTAAAAKLAAPPASRRGASPGQGPGAGRPRPGTRLAANDQKGGAAWRASSLR